MTFDPLGLYAKSPSMAATTAQLNLPELEGKLVKDGKVVLEDGSIFTTKVAIDYVWNIPALSKRLGFEEERVRKHLYKYSKNPDILNPELKAYLPPLGGLTIYVFGDINRLNEKGTETCVRVHDSCCGSDVFCTDICTCRPYLVFSINAAVDCAQRGGVGVVVYFQKEGRSLGEVIKYRVYNARRAQEGGDRAEMYFHQTESIAGIRDARFQNLMPDALLWLGLERIDWLCSMSNEKFDALVEAKIDIMQRVALPDMYVPAHADVELNAKIASGYHADKIEKQEIIGELRNLEMVRSRCRKVYELAKAGKTKHFRLHPENLPVAVDLVLDTIKQNYPDLKVPYHSRWRHFDQADLNELVESWKCDEIEKARRMIDLVTISVLLDAGAGPQWHYLDQQQREWRRSEGLAVASFEMFTSGVFSSDPALPCRVNALGLKQMTLDQVRKGFQVSKNNPLVGLEGRYGLMQRLSKALKQYPEYFGYELARPGNIVDYVLKQAKDGKVSVHVPWQAVIEGLESIWPENSAGVRRGDVWHYFSMKNLGEPGSDLVPFHKLSQWLTYSLLEPCENFLGLKFEDLDLLTGLAEYRNGGLFVDTGVLQTSEDHMNGRSSFDVGSELVVEWRALTVCLLDEVADLVRAKLNKTKEEMPLAAILQGGTWAAGRRIAKEKRPDASPPIVVRSEGTVF